MPDLSGEAYTASHTLHMKSFSSFMQYIMEFPLLRKIVSSLIFRFRSFFSLIRIIAFFRLVLFSINLSCLRALPGLMLLVLF